MENNSEGEFLLPVESDLTSEKQNVKEFILSLEALPELWDSSAKVYSDKIKKAAAYEKLINVLKKIKPTATVDDVRKKINSLRSNYRKELKRIVQSKRSGIGADEVYTPKAWTFQALHFLNKTEKPVHVGVVSNYEDDSVEAGSTSRSLEELDDSSFSSVGVILPPKKNFKSTYIAKQNELIEKACSLLSEKPQPSTSNVNGTAIYWSEKLEKLHRNQRLFAEKAINDILFGAELGTLDRYSVQINVNSGSRVTSPEPYIFQSTPSPDSNIFMSQSNEHSGLRAECPRAQPPVVIYQGNIGATQDVYTTNKRSLKSLFSSFDDE